MDAGYADVEEGFDAIAHGAGGVNGFFGDRDIAGAGGDDKDGSLPGDLGVAFDGDDAGEFMEFCGAADAADGGVDSFVGAGDEDVVAGVRALEHGLRDGSDLGGGFSFAEDDFREALAEGAVVVDIGDADVFEGQMLETLEGGFGGELFGLNLLQNFQNFLRVHRF